MLPAIAKYARGAFGRLNSEARQDLVEEVVANALVAYVRLFEQGRVALAYPTVLARYGISQVRDHRRVGAKLNVRDVLSPYCQRRKNVVVERLDKFDEEENAWQEAVVQDTRTASVPDIVGFRCDFPSWLQSLSRRDRRIAKILALNYSTSEVAKRFDVSLGRVSQLRRELAESWQEFTDEEPSATDAARQPLEVIDAHGRPVREMRAGRPPRFGVLKMKRSVSLALEILVKLGTCLAACIGCSPKHPPGPEQPHTIHWKGQDSGYEGTTAVQPADHAGSTGKK